MGRSHKCYRSFCPTCGKDKGYIRKCRLDKDCHSCNSKKMAIVGATHNGKREQVVVYNREIRKHQKIIITEDMKHKIALSNKRTKNQQLIDKIGHIRTKEHRKIRKSFSTLLSRYLKKRNLSKQGTTYSILGYTAQDLMTHLESNFEPWMNWDNYGVYDPNRLTWQIDHIKPDSYFNYNSIYDVEFKECWSLNNLQPLQAMENIKKGNKYEYL